MHSAHMKIYEHVMKNHSEENERRVKKSLP